MKGMPITQLDRRFFGVECSGGNQKHGVKAVVVHSTEGSTAAGAAAYLHGRPDGSVHMVFDDVAGFRLANDSTICCGAAGYNSGVVHIEQAGYARWSRKQWLRRQGTMQRAAFHTARTLRKHGLKPRVLKSQAELAQGNGYTFHYIVSKFYETDHTDPGPHFPEILFRTYVRFFYHHPKARKPEVR